MELVGTVTEDGLAISPFQSPAVGEKIDLLETHGRQTPHSNQKIKSENGTAAMLTFYKYMY